VNVQTDISGSLAASTQSLDKLRAQSKQSPGQALKAVAQQFESVFLNMMLKSMRQATPQDGIFDSEQTKMFTGMLDQQMAQNISTKGVGLADIIAKQLGQSISTGNDAATPAKLPATLPATMTNMPTPLPLKTAGNALPSAYSENFQQGFVQRMTPYALQASQETGVSAPLMMGQAALESGWGKREIRFPDGSNSYNLFGIKADSSWKGKVVSVTTTEYYNGKPRKQVANFRAYDSYTQAFGDYAKFLNSNPRYAPVVQGGQGAPAAAQALQRAGYATDPNYAEKLVKVMSRINALS
jgi:flagellar protein FlgJ